MKIAMWSGPRNISTAMMYAFGNRSDCAIRDEPFYAPYLKATGLDHPMRDEILAAHATDPQAVAHEIRHYSGPKPHLYMKHMPLHMEPGFPLDWAEDCVNVHLIRHPARVVASYSAKRENPTLADLGYERHVALFARFPGPVLDSADIRAEPERMLRLLCAEIGLPFEQSMLHWPPGPRPEDGVWACHWYGAVHRSTGFAGPEGPMPPETDLSRAAEPAYRDLAARRLR